MGDAQLDEYGSGPYASDNNYLGSSGAFENSGGGFNPNQLNNESNQAKCFKSGVQGGLLSGQKYYFLKYKLKATFCINL